MSSDVIGLPEAAAGLVKHIRAQQMVMNRTEVHVVLKMPGKWGKRTTARLLGRAGGPSGYIVSDDGSGYILVDFKALDILAYLGEPDVE